MRWRRTTARRQYSCRRQCSARSWCRIHPSSSVRYSRRCRFSRSTTCVRLEFRPADVYDLYIFDGWLPPELPPGNWLIFNPPVGSPLLPVSGEIVAPPLDYVAQDHRLMQFVDIRDLQVSRARRLELPPMGGRAHWEQSGAAAFQRHLRR